MIVVEQRLAEAFEQLPNIQATDDFDGFKPVFKWGNQMHLIEVLKRYSENNETPYPLIYQISNKSNHHKNGFSCSTRLKLILAVRNTEKDLLNENRWATSYANILFPLAERVIETLKKAETINWNRDYEITEFPNYGNGEANFTQDIWDALLFETDIILNIGCINTIIYN